MRCEQIMKTDLQALQAGHTAQAAARRMRDFGVRFLPICKGTGRVIGVLSDGDIAVRVVAEGRAAELCAVDEVMTKTLVTCRPDDHVDVAKKLLGAHRVRQVLVTDTSGVLKGIIEASALPMLRPSHASAVVVAKHRRPVAPAPVVDEQPSKAARVRVGSTA